MKTRSLRLLLSLVLAVFSEVLPAAPLVIPGSTAYSVPDPEAMRMRGDRGVTEWKDSGQSVVWYGYFSQGGALRAKVRVSLPDGKRGALELTVAGQERQAKVSGEQEPVVADFGEFRLPQAGWYPFTMKGRRGASTLPQAVLSLELDGPAVKGAHFNTDPRRNAASVHLMYPVPKDREVTAFYNEVTAVEDPVHTYYMACGFSRGYFGMQVNSATERRIIFSVWDSGSGQDAKDRSAVAEENHTSLLAKGEGVVADVFGNEGTGGHSHLVTPWKTGEAQKFVVTARPEGTFTDYTGYWFQPEKKEWKLIAGFRAPKDGKALRGLYSFSENFGGSTGNLLRKARFGNQWIRTAGDGWIELTEAGFSHDGTGKEARRDRFMGVEAGQFFLSHGGFGPGFTEFGKSFTRPGGGPVPDLKLPAAP